MSDPWGRDPADVNDEDLTDLYNKNSNRPPSSHSVDRWGANEDEEEPTSKLDDLKQIEKLERLKKSGDKTKLNSRPSSQQANDSPPLDDNTFSHNRTPTPTGQTNKQSTSDTKEISQSPIPASKPGTPDISGFTENRKPESKPSSPAPILSRPSSKPNSSVSPQSSKPPSRRSSPIIRSSRPQSLTDSRRSKEPDEIPTSAKDGSRTISQMSKRSDSLEKAPSSSRPSSKTEQTVKQDSGDGQLLRSDSKTIRDENLPLPKAVHKDEIRRRAFDNMKNKKAHPSYLFTKFPRVIEALMRFLPYR